MSKEKLLKAIDGMLEELKKSDPRTHLPGTMMQKGAPAPAPNPAAPGNKPAAPAMPKMQAPGASSGQMKAPSVKMPAMKAPAMGKALSASEDKGHGEHLAKWMKGYMEKCSMAKSAQAPENKKLAQGVVAPIKNEAQPLSSKVKEATKSVPLSEMNDPKLVKKSDKLAKDGLLADIKAGMPGIFGDPKASTPPPPSPGSDPHGLDPDKAKAFSSVFKSAKQKPGLKKDDKPHPAGSPEERSHAVAEHEIGLHDALKDLHSTEERKKFFMHLGTLKDPSKLRSPGNK